MSHATRHYSTLGVRQNAPVSKIRHVHTQWVSDLHPWAEDDADERWARQQILNQVNAAYAAVLRSRKNRAH